MNRITRMNKSFILFGILGLFLVSCTDDEKSINSDEELTQSDLKIILETDDISGIADSVISELYMNNGSSAKSAKSAKLSDCYEATYSDTGFSATFNNCVLNGTENVNGTLTVVYGIGEESTAYTATYNDFYVGDIKINGSRSFVMDASSEENSFVFTVTSDMTVVLGDESIIVENGIKTVGFTFGDSLETSIFSIDGNWTLKVEGDTYKVAVGTILEGNLSCSYLTSGQMSVDKNGLMVMVGFGDGSCDDMATITYPNGATEDISLKD
ncbi:hypothetical protein [uncultured Kriegella sp.]|uniref:hypothetical protein n=1 Tax=uncultured Kriegella sp. TaxID=1798910 RepID=UPI0030DC463C